MSNDTTKTMIVLDDPFKEMTEEDRKKLLKWYEETKGILLEQHDD